MTRGGARARATGDAGRSAYRQRMVTITARYEGDLRCTAQHGPSDATLTTDAPVDNHGRGEAFSPTDLVATALASCAMTIMGIVAAREGIDLRGTTASVEKHMAADPRRIDRLPLTITIPAELDDTQRQKLEAAARSCPVAVTLGDRVDHTMRFVYGTG